MTARATPAPPETDDEDTEEQKKLSAPKRPLPGRCSTARPLHRHFRIFRPGQEHSQIPRSQHLSAAENLHRILMGDPKITGTRPPPLPILEVDEIHPDLIALLPL